MFFDVFSSCTCIHGCVFFFGYFAETAIFLVSVHACLLSMMRCIKAHNFQATM